MDQYTVTGMSCAACQARVEKAVSKVPGVESCNVSLLTNTLGVEGTASASDIMKAVEDAGYGASPKGADTGRSAGSLTAKLVAEEEALSMLEIGPEYRQVAIKTEKALKKLLFIKSEKIEKSDDVKLKEEQDAFQIAFAQKLEKLMGE